MQLRGLLILLFAFIVSWANAQETDCTDNIDNDSDGLIDCQDPDCPSCATVFSCTAPYTYYMPPVFGSRAGGSYSSNLYNTEDLVLSTLGKAATVQIRQSDGTLLQTISVPVANPVNVTINGSPISTALILRPNGDLNKVLSNAGLIITSDQPLQAAYRQLATNNQDLLQLQGRAALGRSFYAASQTDMPAGAGSQYERHFVSVMATENATQVSFKIPTTATLHNGTSVNVELTDGSDNTTSTLALPANRTITVTLNQGQSYMIATRREDITVTGILVTSNKDIIVNSGSQHSATSQGSDSDAGIQQLVPTQALETRYIAIDGGNTSAKDYVVMVAIENNTTFTINGVSGGTDGRGRTVPTTLGAGQHFTYYFDDTNYKSYYISSNKRIYVYHASAYGTSEFGMDILPPINECIGSKQLDFERPGTNSSAFVIIPTAGLSSLRFRNQPYTVYAASVDPDGAGPLSASQANAVGTSGYSYVVFQDGNIATTGNNNRVTSDIKFHLGVNSRTGGTGNYAFFSNYEKSIEILDPVALQTTNYYIAGQVTPGVAKNHCVILTGCGANNVITEAAAGGWGGPGTEGTVTFSGSCVIYTMKTDAPPCATETVSLVAQNEFGIKSQVCLVFENATRPFTIGSVSPSNAFFCSTGLPSTTTLNVPVTVPSGTATFDWKNPSGATVTPTNTGTAPNFNTSIVANQAGNYQLTITVGSCSQTITIPVGSLNCTNTDGDPIANFADLDDDNDGIPDIIESGGFDPTADADSDGTPNFRDTTPGGGIPAFVDTNGDGVSDLFDYDMDGIINAFDLDSDNDGIQDVLEAFGVDVNGNGVIDNFTDTDNDGLSQNVDANNSGSASSGNGLGLIDTDGDGIANIFDLDSDDDGIPDLIEAGGVDNDNDGTVDSGADANGNGFIDVYDSNPGATGTPLTSSGSDTNNDGRANSYPQDNLDTDTRPNYLDSDSDGDGIIDFIEAGFPDTDTNGRPDGPRGADGWSDAIDALGSLNLRNSDGHGLVDYLDIDADNDGIPDIIEGQATSSYTAPANADADNDGLDNAYDNNDALFGGAVNNGIQPVNSDATIADYIDNDADNDGESDAIEGWDTNGNDIIDGVEILPGTQDSDGDGLLDNYDANDVAINPTNGTTPATYPDMDDPGRDRDWRDAIPVANNDSGQTNESTGVNISVTTNDTDADGVIDVATVDLNTATAGIQNAFSNAAGNWSVNASGTVQFVPALGFSGAATITYYVNDNEGSTSNSATITITVNDSPVANNDNQSTNEDNSASVNVVANDTDSDGTINAASVDLDPGSPGTQTSITNAAGNWSVNVSGTVSYMPTLNFNGPASLSYVVTDDRGAVSNTATITITVNPVNDLPTASDDAATTSEDTPITINVISNDSDVDGTISAASVDLNTGTAGVQMTRTTAEGNWSSDGAGVVTFAPVANFTGTALLTYRVADNSTGLSNIATITVTVTPVNDAPVAVNDNTVTTNEDTPVTFNVTTNDTDVDGTINAATVDLDPATAGIQNTFTTAAGSWSVNATGNVTYTPTLNFNGSAAITYRVNDNTGATSASATITVTVTPVNDAPVAVNDNTVTTNEDTPVTFNVTTNDTDVDGTINAATVDLDPATAGIQNTFTTAAGSWSVNATGNVTYTPTLNFNGSAAITYRVNDNTGATSASATITVTVTPVNDAPVAVNDNAVTTNEDTPVTFNVTTNDTDVDGTINAATVDLDPATAGIQNTFTTAAGSWSVNATGNVTYTPTLNFNGSAAITYRVNDNTGATSASATITVTVTPVNDAPVAVNDNAVTTNEDTPVTFNVTTNDTDVDGTINAATVDLDPATAGIQNTFTTAAGSWSVNATGNVTYTPTLNFNGSAAITYRVNDNTGATSASATITVTVTPVNDAPVAVNDNTVTTNEDTPVTFNVTTNDTDVDGTINAATVDLDPATAGIQNTFTTAAGSWSVNATGNVTYTPTLNFNGSAAITYRVNDNTGATSASATITVTVTPVNDAPVAVNDNTVTTNEDTPVTFNVTTNDTDVDGTINAATVDLDPATAGIQNTFTTAAGSWSVNATGNVTYTPTLNFNGSAAITYRVNDNTGATSASATITVTVTPVNDAPVAVNDNAVTTNEDTPVTFNVTTNDTDVDGTINAATVDLDPATAGIQNTFTTAAGSWSVNATGNVTYTPTLNFNGSAAITYRVNDNTGATSASATITVTVTPVNDAPVAVNDNTVTTNEDTPVTFNVTTNDTDVDGTINAATVDLDPATAGIQNTFTTAAGSWSVDATGNVTYTPTLNFNGSAAITYRVNDNTGATSASATITVTVTPVNDAPVAVNDNTVTTSEDTPVTFNVTTNDTDVDGTINAATVDLDPATAGIQNTFTTAAGSWSVNATGNVTYTPTLNFNGSAAITYRVNDNTGATSASATITVTVTPVNDAPVAVNDNAVTTNEDTPVTFNVTTNDTDVDGTINAATVDLDPATAGIQNTFTTAAGSWSVNATGNVTYTPTLNFNGSAAIPYRVNDNTGATSASATITVTVTPVNDAPVAVNDNTVTTNEDTPVTFNVTTNDTDVDGTINAATVDLDPATAGIQNTFNTAAGSWSVNATGNVTYTPTLNFNGSAAITYRVNDNTGATSASATITVTVTPVNDAPVAVNDNTVTTNEDTSVTFNVTTNDTDVDGTINAATVDLDPATAGIQNTFTTAAGSWSVNATGNVTYTPTLNFNGSAAITYRVNDNTGATSASATITVTVTPVNDAPVAVNDNSVTTNEDTPVTFNVTTNDTDVDGTINAATVDLDPATAGIQNAFTTAAGSWSVNATGNVTYTPTLNFNGSAAITYRVNDNTGATSASATITVTVTPVNDAPVAVNDNTVTTSEDTPVTFNVTTNDTDVDGTINAATVDLDPATAGIQNTFTTAAGSWSVNATGNVTYTPTLNFNGSAAITYRVNDNTGATSASATITVTVTPVNDAPVAVNDNAVTTNEDTPVTFNVTTNDTDVDGTINAATVDLDPATAGIQNTFTTAAGSWSVNATGNVTYTPTLNFNGSAAITYRVNDNTGATSASATITVTVTPVNDAPVAVNDNTVTTDEDTPVTFNVTTNDTDVDGTINAATVDLDPATAGIQTTFTNASGSWVVNATGDVTYTPTSNFNGSAAITYRVNDNTGATSASATITVNVTPVNDAPVAVNDNTVTTDEDTPVTFNVTTNDTDVDGTINAATVDLDPATAGIQNTFTTAAGSWSVNATGNVTYTPTLNFNGSAAITYRVNDNTGATSASATITVTVTPVNDAPVAVNDNTVTTDEDTPVTFNVTTNDTDVDGTINAATVDLDPATAGIQNTFTNASGSWVVIATGDVTYTPTSNFNGSAAITYRVNDNTGATSASATITVTVTPVNDAPVAVNDNTVTTDEDTPVTFNVTTNDTDADGTINAATVDLDPATAGVQNTFTTAAGSWSVNATGNVTYTPTLNFNGSAAITYRVNDNTGATSASANITVTVTPVNDAPVAVNDNSVTTNEDTPVTFNVTTNDTDVDGTINAATVDLDPATAGIQNTFTNASGSWVVNATGDVTYTPTLNFNGSAAITYSVNDNTGATSASATITVTVTPVNDAPVAVNDNTVTTNEDTPVTFNVTTNDTDVDGTINAATVDLDPATAGFQNSVSTTEGVWTVDGDGSVTFTPALNFAGQAATQYTVSDDANASSNVAVITVDVLEVNDLPVAIPDNFVTAEDVTATFNIVANDTDLDGTVDAGTIDLDITTAGIQSAITTPEGSWSVSTAGEITFIPKINYNGLASINYTVADNQAQTSLPAPITVTVTPVNDPVQIIDDTFTINEDSSLSENILANDIDVDGTIDPSTLDLDPGTAGQQKTITTTSGTWTVDAAGTLTFIPTPDFNGIATLPYLVSDNLGAAGAPGIVSVSVVSVNDPPVSVSDSFNGTEDIAGTFDVLANDYDVDGSLNGSGIDIDPATPGIQKTINNIQGTWTSDNSGSITFVPASNFNGTATISYVISDNSGAVSNIAILTLEIAPVNDAPVLVDNRVTATESRPVSGDVLTSEDIDPDGTQMVVNTTPSQAPSHGQITINADGTFQYIPEAGFIGTDQAIIEVCDSGLPLPAKCAYTTLTITVVENQSPVVADKSSIALEDNTVGGSFITTADFDPEGLPLTVNQTPTFGPSNGTIVIQPNGAYTYTPAPDFNGTDVVKVSICDSNPVPACSEITLVIRVTAVNDPPVIQNEFLEIFTNSPGQIALLDNDIDADTTQLFVQQSLVVTPLHGSAEISEAGVLTYTPEKNYVGADKVVVTVCDSGSPLPAQCATDTVTISVVDPHAGEVFIPEGFSPNGDGHNDEFAIGYSGPERIQLEIFNRWGNLIYKDDNYQNDWKGTAMYGLVLGSEVPDGTYFYKIKVGKFEKVKSFTLQR